MTYQEWLDKLGTEKLSGIASNIMDRSGESGHLLDLDVAWYRVYRKRMKNKGLPFESFEEAFPSDPAIVDELDAELGEDE